MIAIKATIVAGPRHKRYEAGRSMAAILFVVATDVDAAENIALKELAERGWEEAVVENRKQMSEYRFRGDDPILRNAFDDAEKTGFALVVYP
jgi:hypothetical protein